MTIRAGEEWGRRVTGDAGATAAADDADLARHLAAGERGPFTVAGGDLHRAVGAPAAGAFPPALPVAALIVRLDDGPERTVVAHVVARRRWWRGPMVAVCNVDYVGKWNVAPRAHPNDGRADVIEVAATMGRRARWQAWRRLPQGTHLPHPSLTTRSVRTAAFEWDDPIGVWLDGVNAGVARKLAVTVRPDAFELLV